ncbi:MAG TPA: hypothetical protein VK498_13640 [Ferruginibacter sp.]|nr:hypothetical protein [Ferruginibacter sp.]
MRRSVSLLLCILGFSAINAQNNNKLSSINLSVILPTNVDGLNESQLSKLESKIIETVTNNGISSEGYTQNFVIYPKFEIYDEKDSKGGMRSIKILNYNLSLYIKQLSTNIIFSTYSKSIQGSGYNKNEAISNALESIDPSDTKLNDFVKNGKEKIIKYYQSNCDIVIKKVESERNIKNYESALATLLTVPEEATTCYDKAQSKAKTVFTELQKYKCSQYLQKAKTSTASANYDEALEYLSWIDPTSPCASESKSLINLNASKVSQERKKEWEFLIKAYSDGVALKKAQIQSMNNLAISWLKTQPIAATYITVIK